MTVNARKTAPHRRIPSYYEFATHTLREIAPSLVVDVNRALAIAMQSGARAGLDELDAIPERASAIAAVVAGVILLGFSLFAPSATYRAVTWVAVDAGRLVEQYHVSGLIFLLAIALGAITLGLVMLTVSPLLERLTRALFKRLGVWAKNDASR